MATITIRRGDNGVYFDPSTIKLGAGDFVIWVNEDPGAPHHPTQSGKDKTFWFEDSLPAYVAGQDAANTPALAISGPAAVDYVDALDPSVAAGKITF